MLRNGTDALESATRSEHSARPDNVAGVPMRSVHVIGAEAADPAVASCASFTDYVADRGPGLLRHATVLTADPAFAQDVVQAVLERAFRRWKTISGLDHPDAYVRRMITNEVISTRRRTSRLLLIGRVPELPPIADESDRFGERDALIAELRRLPPRQRAALALRYFEDLPDADIARQLGCSASTVRGYIWRGLRALRVELSGRPDAAEDDS